MKFQMKFGYIQVMHRTFKLSNEHILRKNVSCQVFLTNRGISEAFRRIISLEEVSVIYKLFLENIMSHRIFKSVFESIVLNSCAYLFMCLNAC